MAYQFQYKMTATKDKQQIKCLPIGSNGQPAGIAQEYGTTPSTAFHRQELFNVLNDNIPDIIEDPMIDISNKDLWLQACVDVEDDPNNYEILHIQESVNALNNPNGIRWIKVALRIKETNRIMMASITNLNEQTFLDKKTTKRTRFTATAGWYLDRRTMQTGRTFWNTLKNKL